jgi:hypothetical protein
MRLIRLRLRAILPAVAEPGRCQAMTPAGRCRLATIGATRWCWRHLPAEPGPDLGPWDD